MRRVSRCVMVVVAVGLSMGAGTVAGAAQMAGMASALSSEQASSGLKEALTRGITKSVAETGKPGGFENNPLIRIAVPPKLETVAKGMRAMGMGTQVDSFEHSMNAAAEQAAPAAKSIFMEALKTMSFSDAKQIVTGGNTAGTAYFQRTTSGQVTEAFRPIIEKAMANTGVSQRFDALMGSAPKLPFVKTPSVDINSYVLQKSVEGMFTMMGQEEARIRTNPAAQVTPLLKKVFGNL